MSKYSQSPKVTVSGLAALSAQMKRLRLKFLKSVKSESLDQALETLRLNLTKEKPQIKNVEKKEECKIVFSDLSWYKEKLDST